MNIIKANYRILSPICGEEILTTIERAGRTCYKSEDKITSDSAVKFVRMLINRGHESVLEHEKISVLFVCDRGISHELVRHRIASFSQESTRYCNYSKEKFNDELTFILPCWFKTIKQGHYESLQAVSLVPTFRDYREHIWLNSMSIAEVNYKTLINSEYTPQEARSILPNSLKTEIVVTANLREWRTIFKQRTSKAAHPQMRELMCPLLDEFKSKIPEVFSDIEYK